MRSSSIRILLIALALTVCAQDADRASDTRQSTGVKYGMTWGYWGYTELAQELFHVSCSGTPYIPPYAPYKANAGQCNPYSGDTPCNATLPLLCISPQSFNRPCYPIQCGPHAMPKEFYCGWTEGLLLLSDPVLGLALTSRKTADLICSNQYGPEFRMAEFHDGKYIIGMDETNDCLTSWPAGPKAGGGWGYYGYGVKGPRWTRFWVAIDDQPGNCWLK